MSHVPMTLPGLMIAEQAHPHGHTSSFVELDDGRIFHASHKLGNYSEDGGLTWSKPVHMRDTNGDDVSSGETSLVKLSGRNSVGLAARVDDGDQREGSWAPMAKSRKYLFWRSDNGGETWRSPVRMSPPGVRTAGLQNTFLRTSSGRIIVPVFAEQGQRNLFNDSRFKPLVGKLVNNQWHATGAHDFDSRTSGEYFLYSDDDGDTWNTNQDGELWIMHDWNSMFSGVNESCMAEVAPGRLLVFMRNQLGRLFQAWSNDNGETWTRPQPTVLASSTAPPQLKTLPNGHLLCVWNQENEEEIRHGYARTRLSSAISRDGGRVWEFFQNIESMHETTRVEPGAIRPTRPEEIYFPAGQAATERDPKYMDDRTDLIRVYYPSVFVAKEHVIVAYSFAGRITEHETLAQLYRAGTGEVDPETGRAMNQRRRILPFKWFYGGKEPADNPFLRAAYEPAKP